MKTRLLCFMTGISLDLFTVILLVLLAFTYGYHGGKNVGREEMKRTINQTIQGLMDMVHGKKQVDETEQLRYRLTKNPDGSDKSIRETWNSIWEEAKKIKDKEEDPK